ncbi:cysteine hydrolase family protein [Salicibibacter kimchii]|uniref:Cysteine hydrolase n=1 Tax=Salicibibacter kimchii TaxID=2099786 RepID=A0A345C201_9BACI|nr:isochorismatase family cysteine hydrolase [Salicibibacter kimchii]AXF57232.1 cysteine hydrolase [Salicibibacter kimchii]
MDFQKTALLLIDLQKESKFGIEGVEDVIKKSRQLIDVCRNQDIPIIYSRHMNRSDRSGISKGEPLDEKGKPVYYSTDSNNFHIFSEIAPKEEEIVIDKFRWSAFHETSLDLILKSLDVEHLIIAGFVTDGCVMTSAFDGFFKDYQINLVKDMCAASNEGAHMASILIMANWIYDIQIFESEELIKNIHNEDHQVWKSLEPDSMQFTPETMREMFHKLGGVHE